MSRFMIAAPSSGAGKTTVTLALMRLLQRAKIEFQPAKSGPDYIDPGFHSVAAGTPSVNLDAWAMPADLIGTLAGSGGLVVEAAMGLFDGAGKAGRGSAADLAKILDIPVILVVDAAKTGPFYRRAGNRVQRLRSTGHIGRCVSQSCRQRAPPRHADAGFEQGRISKYSDI
jgi:cobyrinic acid a,c-diamide synthase